MHPPDQLDFARGRGRALEVGKTKLEAGFADDGKQQLFVHAREKFLSESRIGKRRIPEPAIPARAIDMGQVAIIELEDAVLKRTAAVRQHFAPDRIPMRELNLLANAGDQIGP